MPARLRRPLGLAALAALAVAAFMPAAWAGFLSDDYVLLRALRAAGGLDWFFERNDLGEAGGAGHFYRPVWLLWNWGVHELAGARAGAFHAANLLLYAAITLEVWLLARRVAGERAAWIAALAFAVYPRHGESVAWISGSTDLTAVAFGLGALLALTSPWRPAVRLPAVVVLTAAAALSKEIAYVLPLLAAWIVVAAPDRPPRDRATWLPVALTALVVVAVAVARVAVIGGVGGYEQHPWTVERAAAVAVTYAVATVTPSSVPLFRSPAFLLVPLVLLAAVVVRTAVLARRHEAERLRLVGFGAGWFAIAILPLLNLAVDLNNANGERLMLLASVGFAIALAGLAPARARPGVALAVAFLLALSLYASFDWVRATRISDRLIAAAAELAPPGGELLLLSSPENYRTAHVFTSGDLSPALELSGHPGLRTATCTHVVVRDERAGSVRFTPAGATYAGRATWEAPFDFPAFREVTVLSPECSYSRGDDARWPIGVGLTAVAAPLPAAGPRVVAYFDGRDFRRCC